MTFFLRPSLVNHRAVDGVVMQSVFTVFCSVARWLSVGGHEHRFIVRQNWVLLAKSVGCGSFEPRYSAS